MMESDDENQNAPIIHSHTIAARCKAVLPHTWTSRPRISPPLGSRLRLRGSPFTRLCPCLAFATQMPITEAHADFLSPTLRPKAVFRFHLFRFRSHFTGSLRSAQG